MEVIFDTDGSFSRGGDEDVQGPLPRHVKAPEAGGRSATGTRERSPCSSRYREPEIVWTAVTTKSQAETGVPTPAAAISTDPPIVETCQGQIIPGSPHSRWCMLARLCYYCNRC